MMADPIVDEIHRIRAKRLADFGGDLERYMDCLRSAESEEQGRLISSIDELKAKTKAASAA